MNAGGNVTIDVKEYIFQFDFFSIHGNFKKGYVSESNEVDQE